MRLSKRLRDIIGSSGLTRYEIAKRSGVGQSVLSKFMSGRNLNTDTLDRLARVLNLDLIVRSTMKKRKAK